MSRGTGGLIYVIGTHDEPWVKIGCTRRTIAARLKDLQTGSPFPLIALVTMPVSHNMHAIERCVQQLLAVERTHLTAEWFEGPIDAAYLRDLIERAEHHLAAKARQKHEEEEQARRMKGKFGARLRAIREYRQLTQEDLADRAGVPSRTINYLERGRYSDIMTLTSRKLAQALDVSLDFLADIHADVLDIARVLGVSADYLLGLDEERRGTPEFARALAGE